jgi:hypothetical protein
VSDNLATTSCREWRLRRTVVEAEKATEALTPPNSTGVTCVWVAVDQFIAEALMVALSMIVGHELGERATEMPFTERNDTVQAFLLD